MWYFMGHGSELSSGPAGQDRADFNPEMFLICILLSDSVLAKTIYFVFAYYHDFGQ